jgi:hypothetical protein
MKTSKIVVLLTFIAICISTLVNAQSEEVKPQPEAQTAEQINVPESYNQAQEQVPSDLPAGTTTYNIANENETPATDPGAAPWRADSEVEVLRIYSGSHDGNNLIKTVEVRVPVRDQGSNNSRAEYVPK